MSAFKLITDNIDIFELTELIHVDSENNIENLTTTKINAVKLEFEFSTVEFLNIMNDGAKWKPGFYVVNHLDFKGFYLTEDPFIAARALVELDMAEYKLLSN